MGRHDNLRNAHRPRDHASMHRTRAAKAGEHEIARIAATVDKHQFDCLGHILATD